MHNKSRKSLIFTALLSVFAVFVTAVSTFAWFKVETVTVDSVTDPSKVRSGSTNLEINDITGVK